MRLLSLAVVAGLFAVGFGHAQEKKPVEGVKKPAEGEKKGEKKLGRVVGNLTKIDGDKLTVTVKGDGGEKTLEFTTTDKTKFFKEEAAPIVKEGEKKEGDKPAEKKPAVVAKDGEKKPAEGEKKPVVKKPAGKRTEIKLADLKTGNRVAVMAGEDKLAVEVVALSTPVKREK
jgi:hypothetical protein